MFALSLSLVFSLFSLHESPRLLVPSPLAGNDDTAARLYFGFLLHHRLQVPLLPCGCFPLHITLSLVVSARTHALRSNALRVPARAIVESPAVVRLKERGAQTNHRLSAYCVCFCSLALTCILSLLAPRISTAACPFASRWQRRHGRAFILWFSSTS